MCNTFNNNYYLKPYMELLYFSKEVIKEYPKSENYGIIKQINLSLNNGLKNLFYHIEELDKREKEKYFNNFCLEIEFIDTFFEISYKSKYISLEKYIKACSLIKDIPIETGEKQ